MRYVVQMTSACRGVSSTISSMTSCNEPTSQMSMTPKMGGLLLRKKIAIAIAMIVQIETSLTGVFQQSQKKKSSRSRSKIKKYSMNSDCCRNR